MKIFYDPNCPICVFSKSIIEPLTPSLEWVEAQNDASEIIYEDSQGFRFSGRKAISRLILDFPQVAQYSKVIFGFKGASFIYENAYSVASVARKIIKPCNCKK